MQASKIAGLAVLAVLGVLFFIYGGYDDSPGAQLIGALAAIGSAAGIGRSIVKRKKRSDSART